MIGEEAVKTSEIEGEMLRRESVQSSIRRQFGLDASKVKIAPAERGIAEMRVDLHGAFNQPLSKKTLFFWHQKLMLGRGDLKTIGTYRTHSEPMQVVSGPLPKPKKQNFMTGFKINSIRGKQKRFSVCLQQAPKDLRTA